MNRYFDIASVVRAIRTHGQEFTFKRYNTNDFGEPLAEYTETTIQGLYHQTRGYITKSVSDGTISRSKPQPQILTLVDETSKSLLVGDEVEYNEKTYKVTGIDDVNNLGIAIDISLELTDDGT